jgi:hypothetical protein
MAILKQKIDDQKIFQIINQLFNVGILEITLKTTNSVKSISQSNVLSLILSNIYLNELDKFVESLILKLYSGNKRKLNQKNRTPTYLHNLKNKTQSEKNRKLINVRKQQIVYTNLKNYNFKKIKYARYANDFVIGISGDPKFAKQIINKIKSFLKIKFHFNIYKKKNSLINIVHRQVFFLGFFLKQVPKCFSPLISQKLKDKNKRAKVLERLKHEFIITEQRELKKIKNNLKKIISKSLLKNQKYKNLDNNLINKVSQIVAQECSTNLFFEKPFFSSSTLKTIMFANKFDIPKDVLNTFIAFQKAIDSNLKTFNAEIHLAKTKEKFIDESGKKQKVITKHTDYSIQIYAPTDKIKQ